MDQSKKNTYIVAGVAFLLIAIAVYFLFIFQKGPSKLEEETVDGEIKEITQLDVAERPFVTLTPTSDGAEIIISIENMDAFDEIEYELTYLADNPEISGAKIQRGAVGTDANTSEQKYKKSVLLGTASRGVRSPDTGVTDGELTLSMFQGDTEFQSKSQWNLIQAGITAQTLENLNGEFSLAIPSLGKNHWIIIANTIGIPPSANLNPQEVALPIYGAFSVAPEFTKSAQLTIITSQPLESPKLFSYSSAQETVEEVDSTYNADSKELTASVDSFATYIVVSQ